MILKLRHVRRPRPVLVEPARVQMIRETSAFLTWAFAGGVGLPRIPRRAVSEGGFARFMRQPGARAAIDRWWDRTLSLVNLAR